MCCDSHFMREALALAVQGWGTTVPNPMVGAVIVRDGRIIGQGFHRKAGEAHAEVNAFRDAAARGADTAGATIYVTLEPCSSYGRTPPCTEAIIRGGIARVVIGILDPNPKHNGKAVGILQQHGIEVVHGVEADACYDLNRPFFHWVTTGKPLVMLKMAVTLDGKIATAGGDSHWVTGEAARSRVQKLRMLSGAVLAGAETVRRDRPRFTVREVENWQRQPERVVVSSSFTGKELAEYFPDGNARIVDLPDAAAWEAFLLDAGKRQMTAILIEGGGGLAASALAAGAVDYVEFHIAPKILGGSASRPAVGGAAPEFMAQAMQLKNVKVERYGEDIAVCGYLKDN